MKNLLLLLLVLTISACSSQNPSTTSSDEPKVYSSVRMGVEGGKTTSADSHIGIKNY